MAQNTGRIAILHLSDIHFTPGDNAIFEKVSKVGDALRSVDSAVDVVHIIVTGDIANKGQPDEYGVAVAFFESLGSYLKTNNMFRVIEWSFAPGNHDCDLSNTGGVRDKLLTLQTANGVAESDDDILDVLMKPQKHFNDFVAKFCPRRDIESTICDIEVRDLGGVPATFIGLNSAICSKIHEKQGELFFPTNKIAAPTIDAALAIAYFHHPYSWFESNNARQFRRAVEALSDIVLTGHEHEGNSYIKSGLNSQENLAYVEGAVFREHERPELSGFNALIIDLVEKNWKVFEFLFNGSKYVAANLNPEWKEFRRNSARARNKLDINFSFRDRFLDDPGAGFTNARKGKLTFADIFVPGHLDEVTRVEEKTDLILPPVPMYGFAKRAIENNRVLIIGEEQSGKTSFAKYLFLSFHSMEYIPLFVRASALKEKDIEDVRLRRLLSEAFLDQYESATENDFFQLSSSKRILLIDDLHLSPFNKKGLSKFIEACGSYFGKIVIFSHSLSFIDEVETASADNYLANFSQFEVKEFGNQLREELIQRWFQVGREFTLDEVELDRMVARTKITLDQVLGKNLLPSYPIFILIILQQLEATSNINTSSGAHGYLYELLITSALNTASSKIDFDTCYTFLGMLAEEMFIRKQRFVSGDALLGVFGDFCKFSKQTIRLEKIERPLLEANILIEHDGKYWFRYKYCYYYFAARYLSDRLHTQLGQDRLQLLGGEIYKEEYANILIFLAYLSNKDRTIIEVMLRNARAIYVGVPPCDFNEHVAFVNRMHAKLPQAVLIDQKSAEARAAINRRLDNFDRSEEIAKKDEADVNDALQLNVALKTIQVLGQLLKNFPSSLAGDVKLEIAEECYQLGLRTMTRFIQFAEENQSGIVALFEEWIGKLTSKETEITLKPKAEQFVAFLVEAFSTVVVRRVSSAVGVSTLAPLYEEIRKKHSGLAVDIIDYSLKLDHFERFPGSELDAILKDAKSNIFPIIMLRRLTMDHFQRFPVDRATKQAACQKLHIELKHMLLLENKHKRS